MEKILKLTKIDVVKKQLETAIRLYFDYSDPISIHSLTCAAHGILSDLSKKNKRGPMIVSDILIADEYKKEWNNRLKRPQNFLNMQIGIQQKVLILILKLHNILYLILF